MKCTLKVLNKDEWLHYASKIIEKQETKNDEELLKEIVKFNYKFDTIPDESQVSSVEPQSP